MNNGNVEVPLKLKRQRNEQKREEKKKKYLLRGIRLGEGKSVNQKVSFRDCIFELRFAWWVAQREEMFCGGWQQIWKRRFYRVTGLQRQHALLLLSILSFNSFWILFQRFFQLKNKQIKCTRPVSVWPLCPCRWIM